ncbi:DUF4177 domain-containing protein [Gymnodinialimonas sp.]
MRTEYKVVPAPERATKQRGLKGAALFAHSMETLMNELAADGWQYLRADALPQEERSGLTNKTTTYRNLLVFQRVISDEPATTSAPKTTPTPAETTPSEPEDEVTNLWHAAPEDDASQDALVADRQSQRVDL